MTETWLVAHDFSPQADAAALEAARLCASFKGTLRLFHVHPVEHLTSEQASGERTFALEAEIRERLEKLARVVTKRHAVDVLVDVGAGEPARAIIEEAKRIGADHIVVGTHGRTGIAHLVLGSVAEKVVREAHVPVLVVKPRRADAV